MGKDWLILDIRDREEIEDEVEEIVNTISIVATGEEIDPIDIDEIKEAKVYKFDDTSLARSSYNLPDGVIGSFRLTVSNGNTTEQAIQTLFAYEPNSSWQRNWETDHWSEWNKVITTEDALKIVENYKGLSEENKAKIKDLEERKANKEDVDQQIRDVVTEIVAGAPQDFDTLVEISDWISTHTESAAQMNSAIQQNARDIDSLEARMQQAEDDIDAREAKDKEQDGRLDNIEAKDRQQDSRLDTLYQKDQEHDKQISDIHDKDIDQDAKIELLQKEDKTLQEEIDELKKTDEGQNSRLDAIETKDNEQDEEIAGLKAKDKEHETRMGDIETNITEFKEEVKNTYVTQTEYNSEVAELESAIENLNQEDEHLQGEIDALKVKDESLDSDIAELREKDNEQDGRLTNIETKNNEQETHLGNIDDKNDEQDNRLAQLEAKDQTHDSEIEELQATDTKHDNEIKALQNKDTEHDSQIKNLQTKDAQHETRMTEIETNITNFKTEVKETYVTKDEYNDEVTTLESAIERLDNEDQNLQSEIDALKEKDTSLDSDIADLRKTDEKHDSEIEALQAKDSQHDNEISDLQDKDKAHDTAISELQKKDTEHETRMSTIEGKDATQDGQIKALEGKLTGTIGSDDQPVYLNEGTITATNKKFSQYLPLTGGTMTGNITSRTIAPSANDTYDLGSTTNKYKNVYATNFNGALKGNADTATKLSSAKNIALSGDATGNANFDGSAAITIPTTLALTGVEEGSYGLPNNVTPTFGDSFSVPYLTIDEKGRTTEAVNHTVKIPSYSAGTGLSLSGTTFTNTGVTSVATGKTNGSVSVTTNGTTADVPVAGLKSAAYTDSSTYAPKVHTHAATDIVSGTLNVERLPSIPSNKLTGTIPSNLLPSYVDDTIEGYLSGSKFYKEATHTTEITGETGKIYVDLSSNKTYRWSGTAYVEISASLALGETSSTAFRGDQGKTAYQHATAKGSAFASNLYKITTNDQGHVTAATAVTKQDITNLGIPGADTDTKVNVVANTTTKAYLLATTTTPPTTATGTTAVADSGVYLDTTAGSLTATTFKGNLTGNVTGTVSGNAGTATKLANQRTISLTNDVTGSAKFDGSGDAAITTTLKKSGVEAGSYGQAENKTLGFGGTFAVPYLTIDDKGRTTVAASHTVTLPAAPTSVSGNAGTATKLATARKINTILFDGTKDIDVPRSIVHIHKAQGTNGKNGWVKVAKITVIGSYANHPIRIVFAQRRYLQSTIHIVFTNDGSATVSGLETFKIDSPDNRATSPKLVQSGQVWSLWIQKCEAYDHIYITDFTKADGDEGNSYTVEWVDEFSETDPGGIAASRACGTAISAETATTATYLGKSTVGSATQPIYLNNGVATVCTGRTVPGIKSLSTATHLSWGTNISYVVDLTTLAYWNGRYNESNSNLSYCKNGEIVGTTGNQTIAGTKTFSSTINGSVSGNSGGLTNKTLNSTTINNTAGTFSFQGDGAPWTGTDWVGLQVDSNVDKFQICARNNTLVFRQNDNGGTNTSWNSWVTFATQEWANSKFLPLAGGTMTGTINSQTIQPKTDKTYNLGSTSYKFSNIYTHTHYSDDVVVYMNDSVSTAVHIKAATGAANHTATLQAKTGTIALTSDLPSGTWTAVSTITDATNVTSHTVKYKKWGDVVEISVQIQPKSSQSQIKLFTLPEGYRPNNTRLFGIHTVSGGAVAAALKIETSGLCTLQGTGPTALTTTTYFINGIFLV